MKKTLTLAVALVAAAGIWSGVGAMASTQSTETSASLSARVRALEAKVRTLRTQVNNLRAGQACLRAVGIAQYGDGTTSGYYWTEDSGATQKLTSGLDLDTASPPRGWMAVIDPGCVSSQSMHSSSFKAGRQPLGGIRRLKQARLRH